VFRYKCRCGTTDTLLLSDTAARCRACGIEYSNPMGVIHFTTEKTQQNAHFDAIYDTAEDPLRGHESRAALAQTYLTLCGCDLSQGLEGGSILDVASGNGWVTAGLLLHPKIRNCKFHAFDVSPSGLRHLAKFEKTVRTSNALEMSVQDAEAMLFDHRTFDFVIGSSVLHHFSDPERFLAHCRLVLKDGGVATFGEPFALGYGLGAIALMLAQKQLRTKHSVVTGLYDDLSIRIKGPDQVLAKLVDKHLFFRSAFVDMALRAGFRAVECVPLASREFYRDRFIDELLTERGVSDEALSRTANEIYRVMFDLFDAPSYGQSIAAFQQLVLRA
jgi:ubiquinone/menaquinone biosynthesis C-methylase UbiE